MPRRRGDSKGKAVTAKAEIDGDELVIRIRMPSAPSAPADTGDRLIRLEQKACTDAGFELRGIAAKVRAGVLPTVKLGRATYVRMSDLCALAKLPERKATAPKLDDGEESVDESYARLVASPPRRRRRGRAGAA